MTPAAVAPLDAALAPLGSEPDLDPVLLSRIRDWIAAAPDEDLFRVNLVAWAPLHETDLATSIAHFLHLVRAGVMDLSWDAHCPRCNVVLAREGSLKTMTAVHRCRFCLQDVVSRLDDHIEVTFTLSSRIRPVRGRVKYEPSANVEIYLRERLPPGATARPTLAPPDHARLLRFVAWPPTSVHVVPVERATGDPVLVYQGDEAARLPHALSPGGGVITVRNETAAEMTLMVENHEMREYEPHERTPRLGGLQVVSVPAFRALFGSETLSARESLQVRDITLVFTDIRLSTAMYRKEGDVRAYNLVRDHFEILFHGIAHHGGILVKTIGDAVMATFPSPAPAVAALLEIDAEMKRLGVVIRAGVHRGTALVVTLNDRLDYFGTTVNEAARIEGVCPPGEILLSETVAGDEAVRTLLSERSTHPFETELEGIDGRRRLLRVTAEGVGRTH